jgi:hypothetical protein
MISKPLSVQLYQDERLWLQAQENGIEIINHRYVRILFENDFKRQIKWLQDNLQQHRSSNLWVIAAASYYEKH